MSETTPRLALHKRLLFSSILVLALLAALELTVRVFGLHQSCRNPFGAGAAWVCDPLLNFKLKPDLITLGKPLNRAGFRSREFTPKPKGTFRILSLGDSCTFGVISTNERAWDFVPEPYPQLLERLAAERNGAGQAEVLNAGVAGYNSFHGVMLLRTKLRGLEPDLITVRYGWNDHFVAGSDSGTYREPESALALGVQDLLLHTAFYGFVRRLVLDFQALAVPPARGMPRPGSWRPMVPREAYQHNLRRIVALGHEQGARVWLLTSPHAFVVAAHRGRYDEFPMSAKQLLAFNGLPSFERLIEIHDDYNQAAREVGAELGVPVIDMDAVYRAHAGEPLFLETDVPHPSARGHALEAETLYQRLLAEGLLRPPGRL